MKFAEQVEERTNGAIKVDIFPAGQLGDETSVFELMKAGAADINLATVGVYASFVPAMDMFNLPFLFTDADEAERFLESP